MDRIFSFRQFRKWCEWHDKHDVTWCHNLDNHKTETCKEKYCPAFDSNLRIIKTEEMRGKSSGTGIAGAENLTARR